jgi:predicted acetyltransferase
MSFIVRPLKLEERDHYLEVASTAFQFPLDDDTRAEFREFLEPDRMFALLDGDQMVGVSANLSLELTLPGGNVLPMTGVTWVTVIPTHHRRGGLTMMMRELIEDGRRHDEPIAGLYPSESIIYRRFGYGTASRFATTEIDVRRAALREPRHKCGTIELIPFEQAGAIVGSLIEEYRHTRNGMVSRPKNVIAHSYMFDAVGYPPELKGKKSYIAIHRNTQGRVDGMTRYSVAGTGEGWLPNANVNAIELWATSAGAEIDLWQYLLDMDFAGRVVGYSRPVDDTIVELLADPRRWRLQPRDGLHVRVDDVNRTLSARQYLRDGEVVVEIADGDGARSRHHLVCEAGRARCMDTDASPDLTLDRASLGAILLGDCSLDRLSRAGLVDEHNAGKVALASAMFLWPQLPWSGFVF